MEPHEVDDFLARMNYEAPIPAFHPGYRRLYLTDAIYHGQIGRHSHWRYLVDSKSGRFCPEVRR